MNLLSEMFVYHALSSGEVEQAVDKTAAWAAEEVTKHVAGGLTLRDSLVAVGIPDSQRLSVQIQKRHRLGRGDKVLVELPGDIKRDPLFTALYIIIKGGDGGVRGIPTPQCIESHLPTNREPNEDDLRKAWEACAKGL